MSVTIIRKEQIEGLSDEIQQRFHQSLITGTTTQDIAAYYANYYVDRIVLNLRSGAPGMIKIGFSAGADDVLTNTDITFLQTNVPVPVIIGTIPKAGNTMLYLAFTDSGAEFDAEIILTRYKSN